MYHILIYLLYHILIYLFSYIHILIAPIFLVTYFLISIYLLYPILIYLLYHILIYLFSDFHLRLLYPYSCLLIFLFPFTYCIHCHTAAYCCILISLVLCFYKPWRVKYQLQKKQPDIGLFSRLIERWVRALYIMLHCYAITTHQTNGMPVWSNWKWVHIKLLHK